MSNIAFLHDRCTRCGEPIEVIAPSWKHFQLTIDGTRGEWLHDPTNPDVVCLACALAATPEAAPRLKALQARRRLIELPGDATLYYVRATNGDVRFDQFLVRATGTLPDASPVPRLRLIPDDPGDEPVSILFRAWDFSTADGRASTRYTWNATDPMREALMMIDGWSRVPAGTVATLVKTSRAFIEERRRGRPPGPVLQLANYERALREFHRDHGRAPASMDEFVNASPGFGKNTLKHFLANRGERWTAFRMRLTRDVEHTA